MSKLKYTEEELIVIFNNNSDCYADCDDVVMAMTAERFVKTLKELEII